MNLIVHCPDEQTAKAVRELIDRTQRMVQSVKVLSDMLTDIEHAAPEKTILEAASKAMIHHVSTLHEIYPAGNTQFESDIESLRTLKVSHG